MTLRASGYEHTVSGASHPQKTIGTEITARATTHSARATAARWGSWAVLGIVFLAALWQGSEFASTKNSSTFWGASLGLAAFFAWLAVDIEEEAEALSLQPPSDGRSPSRTCRAKDE